MTSGNHGERKHSKYSASGAERWMACPGSVELSEGIADKPNKYSDEGTQAHEVHEQYLLTALGKTDPLKAFAFHQPRVMMEHARHSVGFIMGLQRQRPGSEVMVETRIPLDFIHPEMFGTFDAAVVEHFGMLDVYDYKYGAGKAVSPVKNLQMIFYGLGVAHMFDWNFTKVRLWINQPRIRGYNGPVFWELSIFELASYVKDFKDAVKRVENEPDKFVEGAHCWFCKAKGKCPLKTQDKHDRARGMFGFK